jgi:hypothetical protein
MLISCSIQPLDPHLRHTLQVKHKMTDRILKQFPYDLRGQAGLSLIG